MTESIRILIVDDHAVVREGLRALIATEPGMEVVGEAADGIQAIQRARTLQPDVILLDLLMPKKDGIEVTIEIRQHNPNARILVLTSFSEDEKIIPTLRAGALGYLLKDSSPGELLQAIRTVYGGEAFLHPTVARKVIQEINDPPAPPRSDVPLTDRELEVLTCVAQGLSNQDIAEKLVVSERTIRTHVSTILGKLHLANRTQAALYALRKGLADLNPD